MKIIIRSIYRHTVDKADSSLLFRLISFTHKSKKTLNMSRLEKRHQNSKIQVYTLKSVVSL